MLCPAVSTRTRMLADKFNSLKTALKQLKKLEQWLADWVETTALGKQVDLPETTGYRPQEEFLIACKQLDPEYATSCLREVYRYESSGEGKLRTLDEYVSEMRLNLHRNTKIGTGLGAFGAELEAAQPNQRARSPSSVPRCLCGRRHGYAQCWYLNKHHKKRPADYRGNQAVWEKIKEARKDPEVDEKVKAALKRYKDDNNLSKKTAPQQIDDGKEPTDPEACTVNGLITADTVAEGDDISRHYNTGVAPNIDLANQAPIDQCIETGTAHQYHLQQQHAPTIQQLDTHHDVSHHDVSHHDVSEQALIPHQANQINDDTEPVGELKAFTGNQTHDNALISRWIIDPGSNIHVINTPDWVGWKQTEIAVNRYVAAGNAHVPIQA